MVNCNDTYRKKEIHYPDYTKKDMAKPLRQSDADVLGSNIQQVLKWRIELEGLVAMNSES